MTLDTDIVIDRRRLKRRLTFWRLLAIAAAVAVVLIVAGRTVTGWQGEHIARIGLEDLLVASPKRDAALAAVRDDGNARALIVRINSVGGTAVGGESIFQGLRGVAAEKPVVAVLGEVATSAAYMSALGADHIVARNGSLTGSIGVILQSADITGAMDKLGIEPVIVKSGPLKAEPNPMEPFDEPARQAALAVVMDIHDMFVGMVADRRGMDRPTVLGLADGRVFTGRQAVSAGLIDAIGGEAEARRWLAAERDVPESLPVEDVDTDWAEGPWDGLLSAVLGKTLFSERLTLDGLISLWHPELR